MNKDFFTSQKDFWDRHKVGTRAFVVLILLILGVFSYRLLIEKEVYSDGVIEFVKYLVWLALLFVSIGLNGIEAVSGYLEKKTGLKRSDKNGFGGIHEG